MNKKFEIKTLDEGTCSLEGFTGEETVVIVPEEIEEDGIKYKVTCIDSNVFKGNVKITSVQLPGSITSIEWACFRGCTGLTEIKIPNGVSTIPGAAFMGCLNLTNVSLPDGLETICDYAFKDCRNLQKIIIPNSVKEINKYAFEGCISLKSISIPNGITCIERGVFNNCINLKSVTLPDSLEEIAKMAFNRCRNLTDLTLPKSLSSIGSLAFYYCTSLTTLDLPENVSEIDSSAFENCYLLKQVSVSKNVRELTDCQFRNCVSLSDLTISEQTETDESAFEGCINLKDKLPITIIDSSTCSIVDIADNKGEIFPRKEYTPSEMCVRAVALVVRSMVECMDKSIEDAIETINQILNTDKVINGMIEDQQFTAYNENIDEDKADDFSYFSFGRRENYDYEDYKIYVDTRTIVRHFEDFLLGINKILREVIVSKALFDFNEENRPANIDISYKDKSGVNKRNETVTFEDITYSDVERRDELQIEEFTFIIKNYILHSCEADESAETSIWYYSEPDLNGVRLFFEEFHVAEDSDRISVAIITCVSSENSSNGRDMSKYALNGEGSYNKSELGAKAVALATKLLVDCEYFEIEEAIDEINKIMQNNKMVIASIEEGFFDEKRCKVVDVDDTSIYVNTQWTVEKFDEFLSGMNALLAKFYEPVTVKISYNDDDEGCIREETVTFDEITRNMIGGDGFALDDYQDFVFDTIQNYICEYCDEDNGENPKTSDWDYLV